MALRTSYHHRSAVSKNLIARIVAAAEVGQRAPKFWHFWTGNGAAEFVARWLERGTACRQFVMVGHGNLTTAAEGVRFDTRSGVVWEEKS